ncbi:hypothetical protein Tco_0794496 [Tanacetum coccineum]
MKTPTTLQIDFRSIIAPKVDVVVLDKKEIRHKSHPAHPLTLSSSPYKKRKWKVLHGLSGALKSAWIYLYNVRSVILDSRYLTCANLKETVKRDDHQHILKLCYRSPLKGEAGHTFYCDILLYGSVAGNHWAYPVKDCDYGNSIWICGIEKDVDDSSGGS